MQVVLKDEPGIDANDQNSILERLDEVASFLPSNSPSWEFGFLAAGLTWYFL